MQILDPAVPLTINVAQGTQMKLEEQSENQPWMTSQTRDVFAVNADATPDIVNAKREIAYTSK